MPADIQQDLPTDARAWAREVAKHKPSVTGTVIHGDKRGRELGFPTANMFVPASVTAYEDGVYAAVVAGPATILSPTVAAVSLGTRPTYYGNRGVRLLEAYILDFRGELYDHRLSVWLLRHMRPQVAYESDAALMAQLHQDVDDVRAWADAAGRSGGPALA